MPVRSFSAGTLDRDIHPKEKNAFFKEMQCTVVQIMVNQPPKVNFCVCNGVFIKSNGSVLAPKEVIQRGPARHMSVILEGHGSFDVDDIFFADCIDLAVLKLNSTKEFDSVELAKTEIRSGQEGIMLGKQGDREFMITVGKVSCAKRISNDRMIEFTNLVGERYGARGSPIFNGVGKLVGILAYSDYWFDFAYPLIDIRMALNQYDAYEHKRSKNKKRKEGGPEIRKKKKTGGRDAPTSLGHGDVTRV